MVKLGTTPTSFIGIAWPYIGTYDSAEAAFSTHLLLGDAQKQLLYIISPLYYKTVFRKNNNSKKSPKPYLRDA